MDGDTVVPALDADDGLAAKSLPPTVTVVGGGIPPETALEIANHPDVIAWLRRVGADGVVASARHGGFHVPETNISGPAIDLAPRHANMTGANVCGADKRPHCLIQHPHSGSWMLSFI